MLETNSYGSEAKGANEARDARCGGDGCLKLLLAAGIIGEHRSTLTLVWEALHEESGMSRYGGIVVAVSCQAAEQVSILRRR